MLAVDAVENVDWEPKFNREGGVKAAQHKPPIRVVSAVTRRSGQQKSCAGSIVATAF
jgi:hypothetical protein